MFNQQNQLLQYEWLEIGSFFIASGIITLFIAAII